jgi:hypothetical protein
MKKNAQSIVIIDVFKQFPPGYPTILQADEEFSAVQQSLIMQRLHAAPVIREA